MKQLITHLIFNFIIIFGSIELIGTDQSNEPMSLKALSNSALLKAMHVNKALWNEIDTKLPTELKTHAEILNIMNNNFDEAALYAKFNFPQLDILPFLLAGASKERIAEVAPRIEKYRTTPTITPHEVKEGFLAHFISSAENSLSEKNDVLHQENMKNLVACLNRPGYENKRLITDRISSPFAINYGSLELVKLCQKRMPDYFDTGFFSPQDHGISSYAYALSVASENIKTSSTSEASIKSLETRIAIANFLKGSKTKSITGIATPSYAENNCLRSLAFERMKFNKKLLDLKSDKRL